jgi:hypothetical protein
VAQVQYLALAVPEVTGVPLDQQGSMWDITARQQAVAQAQPLAAIQT